jgi:adenine-specific DNA-methyltransferase
MRQIFDYFKKNKITDTWTINRLLVSAFLAYNDLRVEHNLFIKQLLITDDDTENALHLAHLLDAFCIYQIKLDFEALISLFEFVISPSDRVVTGAIYTPVDIRTTIITRCFNKVSTEKLSHSKIADISCGCGGFLIASAEYVHQHTGKLYREIYAENIYGVDVEMYSVERTQILLCLLAIVNEEDDNFDFHLLIADTLDYYDEGFNEDFRHFDFVVGNPPYVCSRNMNEWTRMKLLNYKVCKRGHPDLYIPFIQIAADSLNKGGMMGFITMNSFLNSLNGRGLREFLMERKYVVSIIDFRDFQIFRSKSTYTCLLFLEKMKSEFISYASNQDGNLHKTIKFESIDYKRLDAVNGWNLNNNMLTTRIESCGIPLRKFCQSRHGIATLSNKTYIFQPSAEDPQYYIFSKDDILYKIEKNICRNIVNSNKLNSEVDFYSILEKVIFPYHYDDTGKVSIINECEMMACYPMAYAYFISQRENISTRDKGHTENYPEWYAFGRTQSLTMPRYKLLFPKIANKSLNCIIVDDTDLMLYNGMVFVSENRKKLELLKCFLESELFWTYVEMNAKPYASGYVSLNGVNIMKFSIPELDNNQVKQILSEKDRNIRNEIIQSYYLK